MSSTSEEKPAIVFSDVRKSFKINHTQSFKETFIASLKRKELSTHFNAVDDVSFEVPRGQSVALMGRNGSGKSTTLKLLSGVLLPDGGWVRTRGRTAGLIEVGAGFHPDLTGRENVYLNAAILGMSKEETEARFEQIVEFSEIGDFIDTEVKRYSSGMYARLGFSVAVHTEFETLLVDEVLSVGDAQFRLKCEQRMLELREQGKTMFIVSHAAGQLKKLCDRGIVLEKGRVVFDGPIDEAVLALNQPEKADLPFPVSGPIGDVYFEHRSRYGAPVSEQILVLENGGGLSQEFENGIITSYSKPDGSSETIGLTKGIFLAAYKKRGAAGGPWGFIAGGPSGNISEDEPRSMPFSNGVATYTIDDGMSFSRTTEAR
ncbi:ABC transporter ATP-binding protein [Leucobacter tardus]|uniref:ABC transporter ATP-binding protein n=1 Tax=Leucobacter tardus TaxID=501483 RepID=A0A939QAY5_9MICO|nr:ABC transporter ATP-binding protein [Leucobacter tardus]MBO2988402.1 ABC transporter ATP-binding protein [Leucobacter tardus]